MTDLEAKAQEIADAVIARMIDEDNYDAVHELAARAARAEIVREHLLDISGLHLDNQNAIRQIYIEIVGGIPYGNTLDLAELDEPLREAFENVTVGLLAWQTSVKERNKDYSDCFEQLGVTSLSELVEKLTECPQCGPNCQRGAAHNARAEDGVSFTENIKRTMGSW